MLLSHTSPPREARILGAVRRRVQNNPRIRRAIWQGTTPKNCREEIPDTKSRPCPAATPHRRFFARRGGYRSRQGFENRPVRNGNLRGLQVSLRDEPSPPRRGAPGESFGKSFLSAIGKADPWPARPGQSSDPRHGKPSRRLSSDGSPEVPPRTREHPNSAARSRT